MKRTLARIAPAAAAVTLLGCAYLTDPLPDRATRFDPPAAYTLWWNLTTACAGVNRPMSSVKFYTVPSESDLGPNVTGKWYESGNRIVLVSRYRMEGALVRHEMLHSLVRVGGHERRHFLEKCGGQTSCVSDAGPTSIPDERIVQPGRLQLSLSVVPVPTRRSQNDGRFVIRVSARNPDPVTVVVSVPTSSLVDPPVSFSLEIGGNRWRLDAFAWDNQSRVFAPGETKSFVFDIDAASLVPSGVEGPMTIPARPGFGGSWGAQQFITVAP
jgi:hypothetical protein